MKERPILFSGSMVRAILEGRKTQTRRVMKSKWYEISDVSGRLRYEEFDPDPDGDNGRRLAGSGPFDPAQPESQRHATSFCPYGQPGDRLWVRETLIPKDESAADGSPRGVWAYYAADKAPAKGNHVITKTVPSIFMPRLASRLNLEIVNVRVERLQEISGVDALAEGVQEPLPCAQAFDACSVFSRGWDALNAKRDYSWASNPWVWVVEFKKAESK